MLWTSFVQEWSDVWNNVHLLHYRNDIGVSEAVVDGTQRQEEHESTFLEWQTMINVKMYLFLWEVGSETISEEISPPPPPPHPAPPSFLNQESLNDTFQEFGRQRLFI